jgi:Mor family transcriptional regulator
MVGVYKGTGTRIQEDSYSVALFEALVELGGGEVALEFFRRFQSQKVSFPKKEEMSYRLRKYGAYLDSKTGKYDADELAVKYSLGVTTVRKMLEDGAEQHVKECIEVYNTFLELLGEKKTAILYERFAKSGAVLCRLKSLVRDERDRKIRELHSQGVPHSDLVRRFDLSLYHINEIIHFYKDRDKKKKRWEDLLKAVDDVKRREKEEKHKNADSNKRRGLKKRSS